MKKNVSNSCKNLQPPALNEICFLFLEFAKLSNFLKINCKEKKLIFN